MRLQRPTHFHLLLFALVASIPWGSAHALPSISREGSSLVPASIARPSRTVQPPTQKLLYRGEYHDVKIVRSPYGHYIANGFKECFLAAGISATIVEAINNDDAFRNVLYFVLHSFNYEFPVGLRYVVYQLEQKQQSKWFNDKYLKILAESAFVFDYSIQNYQHLGVELQEKTAYLPVPVSLADKEYNDLEFDVLFYGDVCPRRKRILDELQNKHGLRIKVVSTAFGKNLDELIQKTRIVLNLHYYDKALLETTRINEALQWGKIVVSEEPMADDKYSHGIYKNVVLFVKNMDRYDKRHVEELAMTLKFYSDPANYRSFIESRKEALASLKTYCFGRFVRGLLSLQAFSVTRFYKRLYPETIYYLSLDESWETRRQDFLRQAHLPANLKRIAGIKASPGWTGRGMSYKFALNSAKMSGLDKVTICEDDVEFSATFEKGYKIIREYLSTLDKWDVFVGLNFDVDNSTTVLDVETYKGLEFVTIDKLSSTAFNIYNSSSYDHMLAWDETETNGEINTIERFLQNKHLTVITTSSSFVKQLELEGASWDSVKEPPTFSATSVTLLSTKIQDFKIAQTQNARLSRARPNRGARRGLGQGRERNYPFLGVQNTLPKRRD